MKLSELPVVAHEHFGAGYVLGERIADIGPVRDVFFLDGKLRAVLPGYLSDAAKPDATPKALRAAYSAYRKAHRKPKAEPNASPEREREESTDDEPREVLEMAEVN